VWLIWYIYLWSDTCDLTSQSQNKFSPTFLYTHTELFHRFWRNSTYKPLLGVYENYHVFIQSFIQVVCFTTGPKPLPKQALHIVRSRVSSFKWGYPLLSSRSSRSFLRLLPRLPVTSIPPFIFHSITRCRRQFLCKTWPIQFAFRLRISCKRKANWISHFVLRP
jgi:hypothetical protein